MRGGMGHYSASVDGLSYRLVYSVLRTCYSYYCCDYQAILAPQLLLHGLSIAPSRLNRRQTGEIGLRHKEKIKSKDQERDALKGVALC